MKYILIDLDNCISNDQHRRHFLEKEPKDWDSYLDSCHQDSVHPWSVGLIESFIKSCYGLGDGHPLKIRIAFVSGRMERVRQKTVNWIISNFLFDSEKDFDLCLRRDNDFRKAWIFKEEVVKSLGLEPNDILFAMDDDTEIAKMYERNGITCLVPWSQKR